VDCISLNCARLRFQTSNPQNRKEQQQTDRVRPNLRFQASNPQNRNDDLVTNKWQTSFYLFWIINMPLTKSKAIEAFQHILSNVLKVPEKGLLSKALETAGYGDIWGLVTLSDADIESLTYDQDDMEKDIPLGRANQSLLCIFCHCCDHWNCMGTPIGDDWFAISTDDFNAYCTSPDYRPASTGSVIPPLTASAFHQPITAPLKWRTPSIVIGQNRADPCL